MHPDPNEPRLPAPVTRQDIVYLDAEGDRPVSPYSPEGEIRGIADFASGLSGTTGVKRWIAIAILIGFLLPLIAGAIVLLAGL